MALKSSHAVQALFAICHDPDVLAEVAALAGKVVAIDVTAAGSVEWHEQDAAGAHCPPLSLRKDQGYQSKALLRRKIMS